MKIVTGSLVAVAAVSFLSAPALAVAGVATQGSDSTNYYKSPTAGWRMQVCDREADGYGVHGDFDYWYNNERHRFDESGGSASSCDEKSPGVESLQGLWRHRTVEERPAWNEVDVKGDWHNH